LSVFTVDRAGFSAEQYGLLLTLNGLIVAALQYPVTRMLGFASRSVALTAGCLLYSAGYLAIAWVGGFPVAAGAMAILTMGEIVLAPTTLAVVGSLAPPNWRGRYMGLFGLSETLGMACGPLIGGILLDAFPASPLAVWGTISLIATVPAVGFRLWCNRWRPANDTG
jgi:MFS family permease